MKHLILKLLNKLYAPILHEVGLLRAENQRLRAALSDHAAQLKDVQAKQQQIYDITAAVYDGIPSRTSQLHALRQSPAYAKAFQKNPLVTVRIATYNRADDLIKIAIASVLKQTYQNFEIVVVGDHCTDDTEAKLKKLNDPRIRFYNLPSRINYPKDRVKKWRVIGTAAINTAASIAKGAWIAALDDDDQFTPDHLEKLVAHALDSKCELVYGASIRHNLDSGNEEPIWSFPPERGKFSFHSALYLAELDKIFKYDFRAWAMDEPADWNMARRMMESGVKISAIKDVLGTINYWPATHAKKDY